VDGYWYNGKPIDVTAKLREIAARLPSVEHVVVISYLGVEHALEGVRDAIDYVPMPFNAPLYILYSSGTTGIPKCIVHGIGGTLIQHLKEHQLHGDIG